MIFLSLSCAERTQEEIENIIQSEKSLERANLLCQNLPKPIDFKFVKKTLGGNTNTASVGFVFNKKSSSEEIMNYYENWSKNNGWDFEDSRFTQMSKGKQKIILLFEGGYDGNFTVYCEEPR